MPRPDDDRSTVASGEALLVAATLLALAGGAAVFFAIAWSFGMLR